MLDAARVVFAEKGYDGATIDEIAHRAQYGKGTLYNYFEGGKESLLRAILDKMYDDLRAITSSSFAPERLAAEPLRPLFYAFLVRVFSYYHEHLDVFLILLKEAYRLILADEQRMASYFATQRDELVASLRPALEHGVSSGQLRDLPIDALGQIILGNIKGCQLHACLASRNTTGGCRPDVSPEAQAQLLTTLLFDGMLRTEAEGSAELTDQPQAKN